MVDNIPTILGATMKTEKDLQALMNSIIENIQIKDKKEIIHSKFESDYDDITFEGHQKTFNYDYPVKYPFNILKVNNTVENQIIVEYLHIIPKRVFNVESVDYKSLIDLTKKLKHTEKREDLIVILNFLKHENFTAIQPEMSDDGWFMKFLFCKDEFTVKMNIKAIFYDTCGWDVVKISSNSLMGTN